VGSGRVLTQLHGPTGPGNLIDPVFKFLIFSLIFIFPFHCFTLLYYKCILFILLYVDFSF
jgi:hypothetical protein